jgi:HEAT repeat protein
MRELNLWAVGNALRVINDKSSYNVIIDLCKNKTLGISRQMMLVLLSRSKTEEAFQTLIECLKEPKLKGHAIEALGKFGDKRAIDIIRNTDVEKGKYEFKAKQTALKRLQKK